MMPHPSMLPADYNLTMAITLLSSFPGHIQLRRLVTLRGIAIAVQSAVLLIVWRVLKLELDWLPMLLTVSMLVVFNLFTWQRLRYETKVSRPELFIQLSVDVIALTALLYYSGGSTNPFVSLYLLPLVIAAATLPARYTWGMAMLTTLCYTLLMKYYVPLPMLHGQASGAQGMGDMQGMGGMADMAEESIFSLHVFGMWLGFVLSAVIIAWFVVRMAQAVRSRDEMLVRVREEALRNERIVALGTQAAGAAHELGTPLATMAVVIGELQHDAAAGDAALKSSLVLLDEQVRNCRRILDKILANAQDGGEAVQVAADKLMQEVLDEWQLLRPAAPFSYHSNSDAPAPEINVDVTLRAALMNLLNNAADASPQPVDIQSSWDDARFTLEIHDQGKGLNEEVARRAGSAFFTTKQEGRGLGLFLANATIERMGGSVRLFNRTGGGATTELVLPVCRELA